MTITDKSLKSRVEDLLRSPAIFSLDGKKVVVQRPSYEVDRTGQFVAVSFALIHQEGDTGLVHIDRDFIPPLAEEESGVTTSAPAGPRVVTFDSKSESLGDDLVIRRGMIRYRYVFKPGRTDGELREDFQEYLLQAVRAKQQERAGEVDRINAAIRAVAVVSPDTAEVRMKGRQYVASLVSRGDELAVGAWWLTTAYYLGGLFSFLVLICFAASFNGFSVIINHAFSVSCGAFVYAGMVEVMKRTIALAQREYSVSQIYRIGAARIAAVTRSVENLTSKELEAKNLEATLIIEAGIRGCQKPTGLSYQNPDTYDLAIQSLQPFKRDSALRVGY
jgi:hypothetical protein